MKKNKTFNLLKTMLKTSYDTSNIIDTETKKLNKRSSKVWLIGLVCIITIYISYIIINTFKKAGIPELFLDVFFLLLQVIVMLETILLSISVVYFSNDIENYLSLPISSTKLMITKFSIMMSIIFGSEIIIAIPSLFIYGVRNANNLAFYLLAIIVLFLVSIFLSAIVSIIMIFVMRIFRFIKSRYLYQNVVILAMTCIIFVPLITVLKIGLDSNNVEEAQIFFSTIERANQYFIATDIGVKALSELNYNSIINVLKILGLDLLAVSVLFGIAKFTYIKDILRNLSIFNKKKNKKIHLETRCKVRNKKYAYFINEIKGIMKNPTYFMHYIYNVLIILAIIVLLAVVIFPIVVQVLISVGGEDIFEGLEFGFTEFSIIIGIIQVAFILSSMSLTAISRYGKNAIFFKYIPIEFKTQFKLKNILQITMNTIIAVTILVAVKYLIPVIDVQYILLMFIVSMLLNIINSNTLLFLDLLRPQLNYENDISVIKQNDNKLFHYILTVLMCIIIWYLKEVTKALSLNVSILIEIIVFAIVIIGMEIFINKKNNRLFKHIQ